MKILLLEYKKKMWFMVLIAVLASGSYALMFYDLYSTERTAADSEASLQETDKRVKAFNSLRSLQNEIAKDSDLIKLAVAQEGDQVAVIEYIESLGKNVGAYIAIQSIAEEGGEGTKNFSFDVIAEGSWSQITQLMNKIEHMKYVSTISMFTLQKVDSVQLPSTLNTQGDVQTVRVPATQASTAGWRASYRLTIPVL